ncbi:porin [Ectothiorhodospira marina]|uniref:Outer membrane protein (Porin) n=1 Tax=Ectothiorhodospira marina TaxID=1396821 RepID=A0A1H7JBE4_9GAMM|nr:porin [Ectothiorhodospira marina]SEK71928.1 Outer membrane protein (porin) [Ectothiorhodospira marina]
MNRKTLIATAVTAALAVPAYAQANDLNFDFYGSARVGVESVHPDNDDVLDSYTGVRDAYSRIGFNADYPLAEGLTLIGKFEVPFDIANKAVQDPWDQDEDIRVAKIGVQGDMGTLTVGQMWVPYYNAIAYPVDMFSSYYSGFATQSAFRISDTVAYYSPDMNGFSMGFSWSDGGGAEKSSGSADNRVQLTGSYSFGNTTLALGMDDRRGANDDTSVGASLAHTMGNLYIGAKYERRSSDDNAVDGNTAINAYAAYSMGNNTFKAMVAEVEGYGETVVHLGYDYQMTDALMLFAEYYNEEETAAIDSERGAKPDDVTGDYEGGQVFTAGVRYDF